MENSKTTARHAIDSFYTANPFLFTHWQGSKLNLGYLLTAQIDGEKRNIKSFETLAEAVEYSHQYENIAKIIRIYEQTGWCEMVYYWDHLRGEEYR